MHTHTLAALVVAAAAACAMPRTPTATRAPEMGVALAGSVRKRAAPREYYTEYLLPRYLMPRAYRAYDLQTPRVHSDTGLLDKEIDRINQMENEYYSPTPVQSNLQRLFDEYKLLQHMMSSQIKENQEEAGQDRDLQPDEADTNDTAPESANQDTKEVFALTPLDRGYFNNRDLTPKPAEAPQGYYGIKSEMLIEPPRQIRQNPNLSRTKTLVAENLDRLRLGVSHEDTTYQPKHIHIAGGVEREHTEPAGSVFGIAVVSAIGAAIGLAVVAFAVGWYTLSKKAKAAADVDYPAYGVTGPTVDPSGDRKLAHSAHMYHYQHQKQQIIAMERNGLERRNGSISDPESEEENEEGDYTVYECPGFATTGAMEVKNPMFSDEPTPATPGKCEVVKPQPRD